MDPGSTQTTEPTRHRGASARKYIRHVLVLVIVAVCLVATIRLFDWHNVLRDIKQMHVGILLGVGLPILFCIFMLRGFRWLVVLGIRPSSARFWQSFCANGAALGLASLTPFLLGEVIKIRLIPDHHGNAWRAGTSAFLVERVLDLSGVVGVGLCGLALHFGLTWLAPWGLLLPLLSSLALGLLSTHVYRLPARIQPYLETFRHARRMVHASLLTIPIWLLYAGLFWVAALAMNVSLSLGQVSTLLGGITLAVAASMAPGGLGVSELGSRGIMLWLGASTSDAEATAIALRMLTPLVATCGAICMLALVRYHRK